MDKYLEADVLIIGAGAAGLAAAITSDRLGNKTILVEKSAMIGGQATLAQVGTICGVHARETFSTEFSGVFANNFLDTLAAINRNSTLRKHFNGLGYVPYSYQDFDSVGIRLLKNSNVNLHLHSTVYDVKFENSEIESISFLAGTDRTEVRCSTVIDASGEGLVCKLADRECMKDDSYQAPAYVFKISNVKFDLGISEKDVNMVLMKALRDLEVEQSIRVGIGKISVVPGSMSGHSVSIKFAYPFVSKEVYNERTEFELFGRESVARIFEGLKNSVEMFKQSEISMLASQMGIRSSSRSKGLYTLEVDDVLNCRKFQDSVANGFWPTEYWDGGNKPTMKFFTAGDFYQIPARSLMSVDFNNLFVCGRGISADQEALSSARVIGTCFQSGVASAYLANGFRSKDEVSKTSNRIRTEENLG